MSLMLSSADMARLEDATRVLLSPLAFPCVTPWRHEAMRTVCELLGAETGAFTLPTHPEVVQVFGLDATVADEANRFLRATWSETGASPEPLLDRFYHLCRQHRLEVWDMYAADRILGGQGAAWNNGFFHEVLKPNGLDDSQALFVPMARGSATLAVHNLVRDAEPGQHLPLLRVLLPALKAGLDALGRFHALCGALDALADPLVVFGMDGRERYRNPALMLLLVGEPGQQVLADALSRMARSLLPPGLRSSAAAVPCSLSAEQTLKTCKATYRLRGSLLAASMFDPDGAVLISVTAEMAPSLPTIAALRKQYDLTLREAEVALLLAEGYSNVAVAERLCISPHTARHHTEQVFAKLGLHSRKALGLKLLQPA